jgi:predicted N-acetyltransferase YhbS
MIKASIRPVVKIVFEKDMDERIDKEIRRGLCECFPRDAEVFAKTRAWHGSSPAWSVCREEDDRITAHVGIVTRDVSAGHETLRVAGIQNVFVLTSHRGMGLCDMIMQAAMDMAKEMDYDCGLLFCVPELGKVYERCGWILLPQKEIVRVAESGRKIPLPGKNIAMFHPLRRKDFPPGNIHLCGNDW